MEDSERAKEKKIIMIIAFGIYEVYNTSALGNWNKADVFVSSHKLWKLILQTKLIGVKLW